MVLVVLLMTFQSPFLSVTAPESAALETMLKHHKSILEAIQHRLEVKGFASEEEHLAETVKEVWWE